MTATAPPRRPMRPQPDHDTPPWTGEYRPYDLVKEFTIALAVVAVLTVALAALFSSPDDKQVTLQQWARSAPADFVDMAATELDGTSGSATYGAPYTATPGAGQRLGPLDLQNLFGVTTPVDPAQDFVLRPLRGITGNPALTVALRRWDAAPASQQQSWASAYDTALGKASGGDPAKVAAGRYGPVPAMLAALRSFAASGGLDGALLAQGNFYQTDYTKPLLFLADGGYLASLAQAQHLTGTQWGMMNETGNYPGQAWLWLYTFWYQVKPFSSSGNADALVWALMALLTLAFVAVPFLPGVRSLPRRLRVYRLVWRDYYRRVER